MSISNGAIHCHKREMAILGLLIPISGDVEPKISIYIIAAVIASTSA